MADTDDTVPAPEASAAPTNGATEAQPQMPQMKVLGQFVRDMSFENVAAQKGKTMDGQPDINVQVGLDARKRQQDGQFEVACKLNITAKVKGGEDTIFAMELDYAGIFAISNVPDNQLHPYLLIECPRTLFPFLRRIVSDVTRDGGFPPLNLETIDFVSLYRNEITRRAQAEAAQATPS
ncbi:protein-export protein SecB [Jannaschia pagri]|uniref:Protein-export protein SecB n=1 Tax=Jannaschia pagri TaxID=2829797 RepID=A0ABQ4NLJ3_9RHOB|nr:MULTISPECIES: protein-export chaperone SecB [unclassified Jannaschia]GIT91442.1 protein-export protein SecB [Jannaschia sp. AI_61]GIT95276.1 protein-export protein SecB [Jannaschia sp. AI_62]